MDLVGGIEGDCLHSECGCPVEFFRVVSNESGLLRVQMQCPQSRFVAMRIGFGASEVSRGDYGGQHVSQAQVFQLFTKLGSRMLRISHDRERDPDGSDLAQCALDTGKKANFFLPAEASGLARCCHFLDLAASQAKGFEEFSKGYAQFAFASMDGA